MRRQYHPILVEKIFLYIQHRIRAGHRKGRGIHPPFAYKFINGVIFGEDIEGLDKIEILRKSLLANREYISVSDKGAGSKYSSRENRRIADLVKHTAINSGKGQLLARIVAGTGISRIIELGTGTGFSSSYMGMACPTTSILTCEGSPEIAALAEENIRKLGIENIEVHSDEFRSWLPVVLSHSPGELLVFLDGDHRGERMQEYCDMIIGSGNSKKIIVLDDIHWSTDMYRAWNKLIERDEISLSLQLYNTGIIFTGYRVQRDHFIINF